MTPIEIIALILIIVSTIKILVLLVKPQAWMNFAKKLWSNTSVMMIVSLILAGAVFYYLIQEITIVQILATTLFVSLLIAVGLVKHIKPILSDYERKIKKGNIFKDYWLYTLIWVALLIWGAKELFM